MSDWCGLDLRVLLRWRGGREGDLIPRGLLFYAHDVVLVTGLDLHQGGF